MLGEAPSARLDRRLQKRRQVGVDDAGLSRDEHCEDDEEQPDVLVFQEHDALFEVALDVVACPFASWHLVEDVEQDERHGGEYDDEPENALPAACGGDTGRDERVERDGEGNPAAPQAEHDAAGLVREPQGDERRC